MMQNVLAIITERVLHNINVIATGDTGSQELMTVFNQSGFFFFLSDLGCNRGPGPDFEF